MSSNANAGAVFAGVGQDLVTGTVLSALFGTPLPANDTTFFEEALDAGFADNGFVGESGITLSQGRSSNDIKDMDGTIIDTIQTEFNGTIKGTLMENNVVVLGNVYGDDNVTSAVSTTTHGFRTATAITGEDLDPKSYVYRMKTGRKRVGILVPKARVTDVGDVNYSNSGASSYDITWKTIPVYDSVRGKNVNAYVITDDGVWALTLVPTIATVLPSVQTAGNTITITGTRFTGATAITVGGVSVGAGKFTVVNDSTIVAVMPAGSAGSAPVIVTNGTGPSSAKAYTRGA